MRKIKWTDKTWNVITGCKPISPECVNCYAKAATKRLQSMARKEFEKLYPKDSVLQFSDNGSIIGLRFKGENRALKPQAKQKLKYIQGWEKVAFHKESLQDILDRKKYPSGSKVLVNSMSDTFQEGISGEDLVELFDFMSKRQDLIFKFITKNTARLLLFLGWLFFNSKSGYLYEKIHKHIWFGVIVDNQKQADIRINELLEIKEYINKEIKCFALIELMPSEIDLTPFTDISNGLDFAIYTKCKDIKSEY